MSSWPAVGSGRGGVSIGAGSSENEHGIGGRGPEQVHDSLLVERVLVGDVYEIPDGGTGAVHVHQGGTAADRQVGDVDGAEVDAEPGPAGGVGDGAMQLGAGEQQYLAGSRQHDQLLVGVVVDGAGAGLALLGD